MADKKLVLIIDDDPTVLQVGQMMLSESYRVTTVPSAENIINLVNTDKPDLILLDIIMPVTSGYEAIKQLKENPDTKNIPVVFLTGKAEAAAKQAGMSLGAADYITKPFDPDVLLDRIKSLLA